MFEASLPFPSDLEDLELYPWSMLNEEGQEIIKGVELEWLELLDNRGADVQSYQEFLASLSMACTATQTVRNLLALGCFIDCSDS
jgi:hypothetical protein